MPTAGLWNLQCYSTTILWDYDYGPETGSWLRFALGKKKKKRKNGGSRKEKKTEGAAGGPVRLATCVVFKTQTGLG